MLASPATGHRALPRAHAAEVAPGRRHQRGTSIVEFVVVAPTLVMMTMAMFQTGLVFHAKGNLNYATFEAARAGAVNHARPDDIARAFARGMTPYYGGGRDAGEIAQSAARAQADLAGAVRIEILSPTVESFDDYASPRAAETAKTSARTIPNANLAFLACPIDRPGCSSNPGSNRSGQTLRDANLLKLRITWGIPPAKQVPLAGRFFTWAVSTMNPGDTDAFRRGLLADGRIPVISHVTVRMQSAAIENSLMASLPGPGNNGAPEDPGPGSDQEPLPGCSFIDPLCTNTPPGGGDGGGGEEPCV